MSTAKLIVAIITIVFVGLLVDKQLQHVWGGAEKLKPIEAKTLRLHSASAGCHKVPQRVYLITGGSGFRGSWIARYLLMRGEKHVHLLDLHKPPADVLRHGATFHELDLCSAVDVERVITHIKGNVNGEPSHFIFYNCSVVRRYDIASFGKDLGLQAAESLGVNLGLLTAQHYKVTLIHIGDALSQKSPVSILGWIFHALQWATLKRDISTVSRNDLAAVHPFNTADQAIAFSSYAWYQGAVEALGRNMSNPPYVATGTIRVDGFATGHIGDNFLTPALEHGSALCHSPNSPISLVHIEDIVRAALALEYHLIDPDTREQYSGTSYTVGASEITTLSHVFAYIKTKRPDFKVINIAPSVALVFSWVVSIVTDIVPKLSPPLKKNTTSLSPLHGPATTQTLSLFSTLQVGQLTNSDNAHRNKHMLHAVPNYSISQTLDSVMGELDMLSKQHSPSPSLHDPAHAHVHAHAVDSKKIF